MRLCNLLFFAGIFFSSLKTIAECPSSSSLWEKVEYLRSSKIPDGEQLTTLLNLQNSRRQCKITDDSSYSNLVQRIALIYMKSGDLSNAITYARESIAVGQLKNGKNNPRYLAKGYYILANSCKDSKLYSQSILAYDSCILYAGLHADNTVLAYYSYLNLANTFFKIGDYMQTILHAEKGALFAKKLNNPFYETYCLSEKAQALSELKNQDEAVQTINQSLDIFKTEFTKNKPEAFALGELANTYTIYARILEDGHKPQLAIDYYNKAFDIFKKNGNNYGCFSTLINIGYTCSETLMKHEIARRYYTRALGYASTNEDTLIYYTNVAAVDFKEKNHERTLESLQHGLLTLPINFHSISVTSNPLLADLKSSSNKVLILNLLRSKGDTWFDLFKTSKQKQHLAEALSNYSLGDKVVDLMRYEQQLSGSKLFWRSQTHSLYENAIEICYLLNDPEKAFFFFEKSKSVLLNDELHEQSWLMKNNQEMLYRQSQLKTDLLRWKRELINISTKDSRYAQLADSVFTKEKELEKLLADFKKQNPYLYFNFADSSFFSIASLQKYLFKNHQSFLELFSGDSAVYSLIVTPQKTMFSKINKPEYQKLVTTFISFVSNQSLLNRNFEGFTETGNNLYKLIFDHCTLPPGRIIVSLDGKSFPVEALVIHNSDTAVNYFVSNYAVTYTYSAQYLLFEDSKTTEPVSQGFMGIAPVKFPSAWRLSPLPGSEHSIEAISKLFREKDVYVLGKASKANFLQAFSDHQIIQLYTHASDSGNTGEPVIFFSDSLLYLSDLILRSNLKTKLVVLSACETGSGKLFTGEGVFSFNRGFAAMGIPSSITNLWSVDDKASYQLTELFYKYLSQGLPTDVALQKSKLEFVGASGLDKQMPFFWSAFILAGKADSLILNKPFPVQRWLLYAGLSIAAILAIFALIKFQRRKFLRN